MLGLKERGAMTDRSDRVYIEQHSILDLDYLDRGYEIKERLEAQQLPPDEFKRALEAHLGYVSARIPEEFWNRELKSGVTDRKTWKELRSYFDQALKVRGGGLGLTLMGIGTGSRTQSLYIVCRELVDQGFDCFVVSYDELVFFLKETWHDSILRSELDQRFLTDFFAIVDIPSDDELTAAVRQDLLARFQTRRARNLPTIFSVNTMAQSIRDISSTSLVGRLIYPFVSVNKPIVVEETGNTATMYKDRWSILDG